MLPLSPAYLLQHTSYRCWSLPEGYGNYKVPGSAWTGMTHRTDIKLGRVPEHLSNVCLRLQTASS